MPHDQFWLVFWLAVAVCAVVAFIIFLFIVRPNRKPATAGVANSSDGPALILPERIELAPEIKSLITGAATKIKNKSDRAPRKTRSKAKARA